MNKLYFIKQMDKYLVSMNPITWDSGQPEIGKCYFYISRAIALDVAHQLNAGVETIEPGSVHQDTSK